ncbi:helix-turn-helix transcriptional regulator [Anaerorhabdus sp.]|uniref:helix-turn-helix domain-containing protein n=1 Tax=Anaerorhabdus sp. TaxID=1872524 RepID=UPI002B20F0F3|nr:helix-turn-helix transcriptional regulator [Anaerorhabdus sp.]MEA4875384.1 helix-turn-helix transcriptional regulator [Anaerorhabdus sp.]
MPFEEKKIELDYRTSLFYGYLVRKARKAAEVSINFIADITSTHRSHLCKIERGITMPSIVLKEMLEEILEVHIDMSTETINETKELLRKYLRAWAICDLVTMNQIISDLIEQSEKYEFSFGLPYYDLILILHSLTTESVSCDCAAIIKELEELQPVLNDECKILLLDAKALYMLDCGNINQGVSIFENIIQNRFDFMNNELLNAFVYSHIVLSYLMMGMSDEIFGLLEIVERELVKLLYFERIVMIETVIANCYATTRNFQKSIELNYRILDYFERNNKKDKLDMIHGNLCYCYLLMSKYNDALFELSLIENYENSGACLFYYEVYAYWQLEQLEIAKDKIEKNIKIENNDEESILMLNIMKLAIYGNYEDALKLCDTFKDTVGRRYNKSSLIFGCNLAINISEKVKDYEMKSKFLELLNKQ